jgi:hypothetical protein
MCKLDIAKTAVSRYPLQASLTDDTTTTKQTNINIK